MTRKNTTVEGDPDCTEVLEDDSRSIILDIIAQLRKGTDLHRVALPTFVLEPRSMLERITDFMSHPDLIQAANAYTDPLDRFIGVVQYFLSGWHIKPKGVKKPYNPVLGEFFRCQWNYDNGTKAIYIAEQVSHHPPMSAYYYASPDNGLMIQGNLRPKPKFLGNSAATIMDGTSHITLTRWNNETYHVTMPNVYARGILFGKMVMELGDSCTVRCPTNGYICELDFKTKGFFTGSYNAVVGKIKHEPTGKVLREISGTWSNEMFISKPKTSQKTCLFDVKSSKILPPVIQPESQQELNESRRLWSKVTQGIKQKNMDMATDAKLAVEDRQRADTRQREERGLVFEPRFFALDEKDGEYKIKLQGDTLQHLETFVFPLSHDPSKSPDEVLPDIPSSTIVSA
ncbi:hypothetical protein LRAMOSA05952 [Lichtheimia ramosa]|uniref:Oxysterol-binding protein n=1 Tax=Lichtheimia ramosa TaxID=688394 RepID=A0A077X3C3_9FUNG|nr:hypothetical protein LRAMOSA05952 [Lichtheimia ramosa]